MHIIEAEHVTKQFRARRGARVLLGRGGLSDLIRGRKTERTTALKDISFTVEPGESLGVIGANGSGKTTLLKILAGVTLPTSGHVTVRGRVASLLELGAGFHPMLTGRENVYLNAGLLGMRHAQVDEVFDRIVEFSGIGKFIDQPVDTYSSGMYVRIGFAVAAHVNPDIFLVDEVLSVGDEEFQRKCRTRIGELKEQGKTIVFVSHDLSIVNTLCDRVILLSKGEMIVRSTPQETIDFYLRQVGREKGIHTFADGPVEAILSHGRVSVFHDKREVGAPSGFSVQVRYMDQWHNSPTADWETVERGPAHCKARGRMAKLPVYHVWELRIENGRLIWHVSLECERDIAIEMLEVNLFLPTLYTQWFYGEYSGAFPEILPGDLNWMLMAMPDLGCRETAVLPTEEAAKPPLATFLEPHKPYVRLLMQNTDYITGCRAIQAGGRLPDMDRPLRAGVHEFMTLTIDLDSTPGQVRGREAAREAQRTLHTGDFTATFRQGKVLLTYAGAQLTEEVYHLYSAVLIGNLWNDSLALQWDAPRRTGDHLTVRGESRRFPYRQHWEIGLVDNGISLEIWLEALESIEIQELHTSIGLKAAYEYWETDHESGPFPDFDPNQDDWRHANRNYAPGTFIRALSTTLPCVTMAVTTRAIPFRMTAINAGYHQHARVLQALRVPEYGVLRFEPGRHLYFEGTVTVDPDRKPTKGVSGRTN